MNERYGIVKCKQWSFPYVWFIMRISMFSIPTIGLI